MFDYSSDSSESEEKVPTALNKAQDVAINLIYSKSWQLHSTTRNFANDICMHACANFDADWHYADWSGMQLKLTKRMAKRHGHCRESCLADAYSRTELFDEKILAYTTKCVTAASIVLASLICLDTFITEQQLASHLFATYFDSAAKQAKKIRHYAYFIFTILCDGCPSRVPSVQNEFACCQNIVFGTSDRLACEIFQHQGVVSMLQTISDNRELRRRYSTTWLAKSCAILAVFTYTKNYFTDINCKKRYLLYFGECLVDCAIVCQLSLRHSTSFISFFNQHFAFQCKKRDSNGEQKRYIRQRWIRELFENWNMKEIYEKRQLGRQRFQHVTFCKKIAWKDVGFVELKSKNAPCVFEQVDGKSNIGVGGYGSVSRMQFGESIVAVKNFLSPTEYGPWINDVSDAVQEINALRYFQKTPGLVKMHFAFLKYGGMLQEIKEIQMCMPLYKCDLHDWIKERAKDKFAFTSLAQYASIIVQLANGLHEMHRASFMHRDIKTLNILLEQDEKTVVWSDLGASMYLYNGSAHGQRMRDGATYWWRAPELLIQDGKRPYITSTASDIWSFGACIVEMTIGEVAFEKDDKILDMHLEECSFALKKGDTDEFGIKKLCSDRGLPIENLRKKSELRKKVYHKLRQAKQTNARLSKEISNYIFDNLIYLLPSRRDSAQRIAQFFSQFNER